MFFYDKNDPAYGENDNYDSIYSKPLFGIMIDLINTYENSELRFLGLKLLLNSFRQRARMIEGIKKLVLLFSQSEKNIYHYAESAAEQLILFSEESETWLHYSDGKEDTGTDAICNRVSILVSSLREMLYEDCFLDKSVDELNFSRVSPSSKVSFIRQKISKSLRIPYSIISFLRNGTHLLEEAESGKWDSNEELRSSILGLITSCYSYLTLYMSKNRSFSKKILSKNMGLFLLHMKYQDVGQISFFSSIIKNRVSKLNDIMQDLIVNLLGNISKIGRKGSLMRFLSYTLREHNQPLFEYQSILVQTFFESVSNINFMLYLKEGNNGKKLLDLDYENKQPQDQPYIYHHYMIKIILICLKQNTQQASFLKTSLPNILPLESLIDLLLEQDAYMCCTEGFENEKACLITILKPKVMSLVHLVYLKNYPMMFEHLFDKVSQIFEQETKKLLSLDYKKVRLIREGGVASLTEVDFLGIDDPNYNKLFVFDYSKWLVNQIFPFVTDYFKIMQISEESVIGMDRKDVQAIVLFCEEVRTKAEMFTEGLINNPNGIKAFQKFLKMFNMTINNFSSRESEFEEVPDIVSVYTERIADIGKKINFQASLADVLSNRDFPFKKFLVCEPEYQESKQKSKGKKLEELHKEVVLTLMSNKAIIEDVELEQDQLVKGVKALPQESFNKFVKSIIVFVESALNKPQMKKVAVQSVQILNSILESCFKNRKPEFSNDKKKKEPEMEEQMKELVKYQNLFVSLDILNLTLNILYNDDLAPKLAQELMLLLINTLEGGNSTAQEVTFIHFVSFPNSENFFKRIWTMVENFVMEKNLRGNIVDSSILYLKQTKLAYTSSKFDIVLHSLRLLQLLCEGHYKPNQNYLRNQFKSRRSYNMITLIVRIIEILQDSMSIDNYHRIIQCFDTIIEAIQGPCYENRSALLETKFLYFCAFWLQDYHSLEKRQSTQKFSNFRYNQAIKSFHEEIIEGFRKINLGFAKEVDANLKNSDSSRVTDSWMHSRIQFKILVTLESILEGRNRGSIVNNILPVINPKCLDWLMKNTFTNFKVLYDMKYDMDAFNHMDQNITKIAKKRGKSEADETKFKKVELILEMGFKAFGILKIFMEIPEQNFKNDHEIKNQILEIKKEAKKAMTMGSSINDFVKSIRGVGPPDFSAKSLSNFLNKMKSYKNTSLKKIDQSAYTFFSKFTGSIEVVRDNILEQVYFPLLPYCLYLDFRTEKQFLKSLDRMSMKSKLVDLMEESEVCISSLKHIYFLQHYTGSMKFLSHILNNYKIFGGLEFIFILVLNFIIFITVRKNQGIEHENLPIFCTPLFGNLEYHFELFGRHYESCEIHNYIVCLGVIQFIMGMLAFVLYMIKIYWVRFKTVDSDLVLKERLDQSLLFLGSFYKKIFLYVWILATDFELFGYFLSLIFNIASLISPVPFLSLLLVVAIFRRSKMMRHILEAIWRPRKSLFFTLLILAVANYLFSFIEFLYFNNLFGDRCLSLMECTYFSYDRIYKYDGGIGGFMTNFNGQDSIPEGEVFDFSENLGFGRFLLDFFSNFVILVLISEILSGIIIDTFGSLREENFQRKNDIQNVCFICGADRTAIEKMTNSKGFYHHITVTHNIWHYMFYIAYLKDKEITEYSGMESFIINKIKSRNIDWFPHLE